MARKQGYSKSELRRKQEADEQLTQRLHDFMQESAIRNCRHPKSERSALNQCLICGEVPVPSSFDA